MHCGFKRLVNTALINPWISNFVTFFWVHWCLFFQFCKAQEKWCHRRHIKREGVGQKSTSRNKNLRPDVTTGIEWSTVLLRTAEANPSVYKPSLAHVEKNPSHIFCLSSTVQTHNICIYAFVSAWIQAQGLNSLDAILYNAIQSNQTHPLSRFLFYSIPFDCL